MTPLLMASILSRDPLRFVIPWLGATTYSVHGVTLPVIRAEEPFDRRLTEQDETPARILAPVDKPLVHAFSDPLPESEWQQPLREAREALELRWLAWCRS